MFMSCCKNTTFTNGNKNTTLPSACPKRRRARDACKLEPAAINLHMIDGLSSAPPSILLVLMAFIELSFLLSSRCPLLGMSEYCIF